MQVQYKNKIIYDGKTSTTLNTQNQVLQDNLIIFNDDTNSNISVSNGENEITNIEVGGIKKINTKGKWLNEDLDLNITPLRTLEYYIAQNLQVNGNIPMTGLGQINTYLQDGDYIEFCYDITGLPGPKKEYELLFIGQPNFQNYYVQPVVANYYNLKYVSDIRDTYASDKVRIYGLSESDERFEEVYVRPDDLTNTLRKMKITKDGIFITINGEWKQFITTNTGSSSLITEIQNQYNRSNNLLGFGVRNDTEFSHYISYLKLVLGDSTKYQHNIIYDFSGISSPSSATVFRGSNYIYSFPINSLTQIIKNRKVFMSGFDVSDRFISNNQINIPVVVGDLEVTADFLEKESVLRENYSPNSTTWIDNTFVDFSSGGYVEAKIDLTNFNINKGNILSVGRNIDVFSAANSGTCIHLYFIKSSRTLNIRFRRNAVCSTSFQSVVLPAKADNTYAFRIDKNGVSVDGTYYHSSDSSTESGYQANEDNVLAGLLTLENDRYSSWQVGSAEGTNRSNAFYEYIKIVNLEEENNE